MFITHSKSKVETAINVTMTLAVNFLIGACLQTDIVVSHHLMTLVIMTLPI